MADIIVEDVSEMEALNLVDNIFEYYKEYAEDGEKLGFFIDRVGINEFKKEVIKDIEV